MTAGDTIRTVEVLPPSAHGETRLVLRAAATVLFGALFVIGLHSGNGGPEDGVRTGDLLPFQVLFRDASAPIQRMYREMQEGVLEAENARAATKQWPEVETLEAEGIPPFALASPSYRWRLVRDGVFVNYVGMPAPTSDGPAFLALIQEPDPGYVDTAPAAPDEVHHRLTDGTLLHVSIWFRPAAPAGPADRVLTQPSATGWTQVLVGR
jgi:uncharacterized protein DUF6162